QYDGHRAAPEARAVRSGRPRREPAGRGQVAPCSAGRHRGLDPLTSPFIKPSSWCTLSSRHRTNGHIRGESRLRTILHRCTEEVYPHVEHCTYRLAHPPGDTRGPRVPPSARPTPDPRDSALA